ncbi:NUDIX domain-containing protein [Rhizobium sp. C1]|uniref:NUDIX domain-containing protein n=1 Tax=Rhizobium sp. C1 TaxID=1349799 RepID=UPI001E2E3794|nr:NUDIX domain-containing protein [Rhizobium sp. C1]MCD2177692.1 NUDIX domain-containing protein [Rhizobium sp. C1]
MTFFKKAGARIIRNTHAFKGWNDLYDLTIEYTNSSGETVELAREVVDHGSAAAILLYDAVRDVVVLVRQFRTATFYVGRDPFVLEAAAGLLDEDKPEEAVRREAFEETGYRVEKVFPLFSMFGSPGSLAEEVHLFVGLIDTTAREAAGGGLADEHEDIEVVELPLERAFAMIGEGLIFDAKTIILLQWAVMNRTRLQAG